MNPRTPVLESASPKLSRTLNLNASTRHPRIPDFVTKALCFITPLLMKLFEEWPVCLTPKASFISEYFSTLRSYFRSLEKQGCCKSTYFGHSQPAILSPINDSCPESIKVHLFSNKSLFGSIMHESSQASCLGSLARLYENQGHKRS